MKIFVVEQIYSDGIDMDISAIYHATTFDKAKEYINYRNEIKTIKQINESYWVINKDYDSWYGVMEVELDKDFKEE